MAGSPAELEWEHWLWELAGNAGLFLSRCANPTPGTPGPDSPITSFSGLRYAFVPRDGAADPLRDPWPEIDLCHLHPRTPGHRPQGFGCAYRAVSFTVARSPEELLYMGCASLLRETPEMPFDAAVRSLDDNWRIVPLYANRVRLAYLLDDPALTEGDPGLRNEGQLHRAERKGRARVREMLERGAALVLLPGDAVEFGPMERLLIFTRPGRALTAVGALRWGEPQRFRDIYSGHDPFRRPED